MDLENILKQDVNTYLREKNENIIKIVNFLVDESDIYRNKLEDLLAEIENEPIEDDFFFKNLKKEDFKTRAASIEKKIHEIEKRWSELIIILNERFNKN
jgi:hypothetical protein